jgi:methyl-accepting chemotaxis protein
MNDLRGRTFTRLLVGLLAAFLPITVLLAFLLTERAADSLTTATTTGLEARSVAAADRVDFYAAQRLADLQQIAQAGFDTEDELERELDALDEVRVAYDVITAFEPDGSEVVSTRAGSLVPAEPWFRAARVGEEVIAPVERAGESLQWVIAVPLPLPDGPRGVLAADLDVSRLWPFVGQVRRGDTGDAYVVDAEGRQLVRLGDGEPRDERALVQAGALRERPEGEAAERALRERQGHVTHDQMDGREYISGFGSAPRLGWAVLGVQERDEALQVVTDQRRLATLIVLAAVLLMGLFAAWFARRQTRPITEVAEAARVVAGGDLGARVDPSGSLELQELGGSFNQMVGSLNELVGHIEEAAVELSGASTQLSAAAEQLATTTAEQSASATETSTTMEELARTSSGIADTVSGVARRSENTRGVLEQADRELRDSSEQILRLAARVDEITGIVELINDIADQTNLLALNASIEAARAGEEGRGFAVVADEVRRLAERSKSSASEIAGIIESTQSEMSSTVMTMEHSSRQLRSGLELMDAVTESTEQVRLTTNQQESATGEVVRTMEGVTDATRQSAATANQIAASANRLRDLVEDLRTAAGSATRSG